MRLHRQLGVHLIVALLATPCVSLGAQGRWTCGYALSLVSGDTVSRGLRDEGAAVLINRCPDTAAVALGALLRRGRADERDTVALRMVWATKHRAVVDTLAAVAQDPRQSNGRRLWYLDALVHHADCRTMLRTDTLDLEYAITSVLHGCGSDGMEEPAPENVRSRARRGIEWMSRSDPSPGIRALAVAVLRDLKSWGEVTTSPAVPR
jgi:hypothetical protein